MDDRSPTARTPAAAAIGSHRRSPSWTQVPRSPSTRFNQRSFVPALWGLALVGTLAACATGPSVAHETSISTATVAHPTTVAITWPVAPRRPLPRLCRSLLRPPSPRLCRSRLRPSTTVARSSAVVDEFATVDGARMHIRCVGSGATTVVLIGGFNDGGDNWGAIEAPLAQDARVCSSARLGTGTSDPPTAVQTFTSQATQLRAALESVGEPGPYVLAGHSFGGAEAVAFASMFPDSVSGLRADRRQPDHLARGCLRRPRRRLRRRPQLRRQLHHLLPSRRQRRTSRRSRRLHRGRHDHLTGPAPDWSSSPPTPRPTTASMPAKRPASTTCGTKANSVGPRSPRSDRW